MTAIIKPDHIKRVPAIMGGRPVPPKVAQIAQLRVEELAQNYVAPLFVQVGASSHDENKWHYLISEDTCSHFRTLIESGLIDFKQPAIAI